MCLCFPWYKSIKYNYMNACFRKSCLLTGYNYNYMNYSSGVFLRIHLVDHGIRGLKRCWPEGAGENSDRRHSRKMLARMNIFCVCLLLYRGKRRKNDSANTGIPGTMRSSSRQPPLTVNPLPAFLKNIVGPTLSLSRA